MKIGLTGGTGFIGKYFVSEYGDSHDLTVLTLEGDPASPAGDPRYISSDFSVKDIENKFASCDAIVHLAFARPPVGGEDSMSRYADSISVSENVFTAAKNLGIANVVVMSSRSVYNASMKMPLAEDRVGPYSVYGEAKLAVEKIGEKFNGDGMRIKFLRSAQVMGAGERKNLMTVYLERSVNKEPLYVYGKGISTKTYIYVKDVSRAVMCAAEHPDEFGAFNIAMKDAVSTGQLAKLYCKVFDDPAGVVFLEDRPEDGERWIIDVTKAKERLGFEAAYDIEGALRDMKKLLGVPKGQNQG